MIDELGGPKTYNHYPNGWAMAFNTPFKMWKRYEFNGGSCDPCIISWPKGLKARGEIRHQYHHAIDIVPTILDCLGVEPPEAIKGHVQSSFDGISMRYSFDQASIPTARATQFYSMLGSRAIWHEGWKAVTHPPDGRRLEPLQRRHLGALPRRDRPLGAARPRRRAARQAARADQPVVRRRPAPTARSRSMTARRWRSSTPRGRSSPARGPLPLLPRCRPRSPRRRRSTSATATTSSAYGSTFPAPGASGVLFAHGSHFGGHTLYVKDNRLHYVYNFVGMLEQKIVASEDLPVGDNLILSAAFVKDGEDAPGVCTGILSLYHGEKKVGEGQIKTQPGDLRALRVGTDRRAQRSRRSPYDYPGERPVGLHRRHDPLRRRRRQRRALRRPRARGRGDDGPRVAGRRRQSAVGGIAVRLAARPLGAPDPSTISAPGRRSRKALASRLAPGRRSPVDIEGGGRLHPVVVGRRHAQGLKGIWRRSFKFMRGTTRSYPDSPSFTRFSTGRHDRAQRTETT